MSETFSESMPCPVAVRQYEDLIQALKARRQQLGMTLNEVDAKAGFHEGYTAHIENWQGKNGRGLGPVSLPLLLEALGVAIVLVEVDKIAPAKQRDPDAPRLGKDELVRRSKVA